MKIYQVALILILCSLPLIEARSFVLPDIGTRIGLWGVSYGDVKPYLQVYEGCLPGVKRIDFYQTSRFWGKQKLCGFYHRNRIAIYNVQNQIEEGSLYQCFRHEITNYKAIHAGDIYRLGRIGDIWLDPPLTCENSPFTQDRERDIWRRHVGVEIR